ncbi:MAG: 4Fe-4S dicluster domain-containing protein [Chloroflexi bacterium]|nr:4Fe-4S dicluster domain-containing protein [Chloroflexota bacterium]
MSISTEGEKAILIAGQEIRIRPEELKSGGLIPQKQRNMVTVRCMAPGGRVTATRLKRIAEVAEKYGHGVVHLSVRMSPEILYVPLDKVEALAKELEEVGQRIASCGKRVRVPTACGGCEYNPNGITDTQALAEEVNARYFGIEAFHKFKISFSGCPIDCPRSRESDLGFQGQVEPELVADLCTGCGLCVRACQDDALSMEPLLKTPRARNGLPVRDAANCLSCGDCIKACPFEAMVAKRKGHAIYVGGKHGKHPHVAYPLAEFVPDEKVFPLIEIVMQWYKEHGKRDERLGLTIDRVGIDSLRMRLKDVIGENLLGPEDLAKPRWRRIFWAGTADTFPTYSELGDEA